MMAVLNFLVMFFLLVLLGSIVIFLIVALILAVQKKRKNGHWGTSVRQGVMSYSDEDEFFRKYEEVYREFETHGQSN